MSFALQMIHMKCQDFFVKKKKKWKKKIKMSSAAFVIGTLRGYLNIQTYRLKQTVSKYCP